MQSKLIVLRRSNLLTQQNVADYLEIDLRTYQAKERGETQFKLNEMYLLSQLFHKSIDEIFLDPNFMKHEIREVEV